MGLLADITVQIQHGPVRHQLLQPSLWLGDKSY